MLECTTNASIMYIMIQLIKEQLSSVVTQCLFTLLLPVIMHNCALKMPLYSSFALPWQCGMMELHAFSPMSHMHWTEIFSRHFIKSFKVVLKRRRVTTVMTLFDLYPGPVLDSRFCSLSCSFLIIKQTILYLIFTPESMTQHSGIE